MKILFVGDYPNDTRLGSAKVPHKLREEFVALGHHCDILSSEDLGVWPRSRHLRELLSPALSCRAVQQMIRSHGRYDVIDAASAEGLYLAKLGGGAAVVARSNGLEHLNYRRMIEDHAAGLLYKPFWKRTWHPAVRLTQVEWAIRTADRVVVLNPADREFVLRRRWQPASGIDLIPHGVSGRLLGDVPLPDAPRGGGVLFCGTWTGVKGVDYLVGAFALLADRGVAAKLTVLGGGVPEGTIRASFPESVQPRLRVVDRVPEAEVMREYRQHDVLAFTSTYEGYGMVLLEAMSQRLPVVSTPVGAALTLVRDGETGLLVPARRADLLADAIGHLVADSRLRSRLAAAAFERVSGMTWARTAEDTLAAYDQAIRARARRGRGAAR